jgi:hypothetical protein
MMESPLETGSFSPDKVGNEAVCQGDFKKSQSYGKEQPAMDEK